MLKLGDGIIRPKALRLASSSVLGRASSFIRYSCLEKLATTRPTTYSQQSGMGVPIESGGYGALSENSKAPGQIHHCGIYRCRPFSWWPQ